MAETLFVERVDATGLAMLLAFAVTLPWTVVGILEYGHRLDTDGRQPQCSSSGGRPAASG